MRTIAKSAAGGALALLLAFSVTPANALDPLTPEDEVTSVQDQVPTDGTDGSESVDGADNTGSTESDDTDTKPTEESDDSAVVQTPSDDAEEAPEKELTATPEELTVSGVLAVVPNESKFDVHLGEASDNEVGEDGVVAHEEGGGGILLATSEGPLVPLAPELLTQEAETGQSFSGTLELSDTARSAIDQAIAADGSISQAEALQIAGDVATAEGSELAVSGAPGEVPPVAAAASAAAHTADIAFVTGGAAPSATALKNLVSSSGSYWNSQTAGKVSRITPSASVRTFASGASRCDTTSSWTQAAAQYGRTPDYYLSGARHLIVFINAGGYCSGSGFGTLGKLHRGGLIWVDIQAIGNVSESLGTTAHEFGHNFGLGHGQARRCSGSTTDVATASRWFSEYGYNRAAPNSPCVDVEYGDVSNIMGAGSAFSGAKPTALSMVQKAQLGVLPSGAMKTVNQSGGRTQTFTIAPASANSGLRGLKVNPTSGGSFFIEYRSGTGQDSGLPWSARDSMYSYQSSGGLLPTNYIFSTGVQVTKNYPGALSASYGGGLDLRETLITSNQKVGSVGGKFLALKQGKTLTTWNSTAQVKVISIAPNRSSAKVQITFTPFTDVPYAHKFGKEINWMSSSGLSNGSPAGSGLRKYLPKSSVTREAMAAFLYRMKAPKNYKAPAKSPFVDVKKGQAFYKEITWMYQSGLSTGTMRNGQRFYDPKASVSREAMAAFMYRMQKPKGYKAPATSPFSDVKRGQKFYTEMTWMYKSGLSTGTRQSSGKPRYEAKSGVSREAMGAFLYRLNH